MSEDVQIYRMMHASMLEIGAVAEVFEAAFAKNDRYPIGEIVKWILENIGDQRVAIFLARRDEKIVGFTICTAFISVFSPLPWSLFLYAPKDRGARKRLGVEIRSWCKSLGFDKVLGWNQIKMDDGAFRMLFSPAWKGESLGCVYEFSASEDES